MQVSDILRLSADLAAGAITADKIKSTFGDSVLSSVLAVGGGLATGFAANSVINYVEEHTGVLSVVDDVVSDIFDLF
jgi:hypothetical protein